MLPAQPNQSLIDGLTCLHAVIAAGAAIGSREVGRRADLERTRTNRLLGTWRHLGILAQTATAKYVPGPGLHVLAGLGLQASGLLQAAIPHLRSWWREGWTTSFAVGWQDRLCFLVQARPGQPFEEGIGSHATGPAVRTAAGLALLATADDADLATWDCPGQWSHHGDGREFSAVIAEIRAQGFATRTYPGGIRSLGVAIPGVQAALAISRPGLAARAAATLARTCKASANAIAERLGDDAAVLRDGDDAVIPA